MVLSPGSLLGIYEIIAPIGAGGMGEVYRARDTKLEREVAIKILPEDIAHDPERLARFKREAQLLASLNQPNIAGIHGLEEHEETLFLALELVEGEDLSERLKRGPIPVDEALDIARQVADALEAAHEKGIIHRDPKPPNIKLTPDGNVKVLDFGLAKALDSNERSSPELSNSPTMARDATRAGVILGTASYMSPEQARGKVVDKRTDIWAFGCVLYEMLTGHKVFQGEDVKLTLAEVVKAEPRWNDLPSEISPSVKTTLERCLKKDPKARIRDIGDARLALEGAFESQGVSETATAPRVPGLWLVAVGLFGLLGLLRGFVLSAFRGQEAEARDPKRLVLLPPPDTRIESFRWREFAISPDGSELVFRARAKDLTHQLYRRPLDAFAAPSIPGTEGARIPVFSPDGKSLAFISDSGLLRKIPVEGGAATTLCDCDILGSYHWGEDDWIYYASTSGIARVSASGGTPESVTTLAEDGNHHRHPELLPGGRALLFTAFATFTGRIAVHSLESRETRILAPGTNPRCPDRAPHLHS